MTTEDINRVKYRSPSVPCPSPEKVPPPTKPPKPPEEKTLEKILKSIADKLDNLLASQENVSKGQDQIISLLEELVRAAETELVDLKFDSGLQILPNAVTTAPTPDNVNPVTGYTRVVIYDILNRTSPELYFLNQGPGTIFLRMSKDGKMFSESENVVFEGEVKTFYDVYELRIRTTTAATQYIVTEFEYLKQRDIIFLASRPFVDEANVVAGVPRTENIVTDAVQGLGRNAHTGFIINDGPNNLSVALSNNGVTYAPNITVIPNQILDLSNEDIYSIILSVAVGNANFRLAVH